MNIQVEITQFLVRYGFQILGGIIIFVCGVFVANALGRLVKNSLSRFKLDLPIETLLVRIAKLIVILLATILTVAKMGVDIAPLVAGMGVIGVGIGLATQGVLANLVAGLLIIFTKPFRIGEYIELVGESGVVHMIDLFSTKLMHTDKSIVVIPNRKISGEILHNFGFIRRLDLELGVTYAAHLPSVERVVKEVLAHSSKVLKEPAPVYFVSELDNSRINIAVKPWVSIHDYPSASGELYQSILEAFRQNQIDIPFPQQEIRILNYNEAAGVSPLAHAGSGRSATGI